MRTVWIAAAVIAGTAAMPAAAQVVTGGGRVSTYPVPGPGWGGGYIGGQWAAGTRAPGGWAAYRRPQRGWAMPGYWRAPEYRIQNYSWYGLQAPPRGYGWSRYYDDAVLVDYDGRVYDSVSGIDWRRTDQPYATGYGYPSQGYHNSPNGYAGRSTGYIDPRCYDRGKGSGVGGALVGGAIGAGVGALTGGLGATLIGGGVGALAGQAIDRNSRNRIVCDYGPGYDQGYYDEGYASAAGGGGGGYAGGGGGSAYAGDGYAYAQGGAGGGGVVYAPQQEVVQQHYGYAPGGRATATFEWDRAPETTTTTTTTVTEEWTTEPQVTYVPVQERVIYRQGPTRVIYKQAPPKVVYRTIVKKAPVKKWRPKPKPVSTCYDPCECKVVCGS